MFCVDDVPVVICARFCGSGYWPTWMDGEVDEVDGHIKSVHTITAYTCVLVLSRRVAAESYGGGQQSAAWS